MSSRTWLRALFFLLFLCFGFGLLSVLVQDSGPPREGTPTPSPTPTTTTENPADETAILVLGVDALGSERPRLLAIWIVGFEPPGDETLVYGLPLSAAAPSGPDNALASLFTWSRQEGVDARFLQALAELVPLQYDAVVVMDEVAFAKAVDVLGGANLAGTELKGDEVLAFLRLLYAKPEALLSAQEELLLALRPGLQDLGPTPDISSLEAVHPEHVYLSLEPMQLAALVAPLLPFEAASIRLGSLIEPTAP